MVQQASRKPVFPPEVAPYIDVGAYLLDARAPAATLYLDKLLVGKELMILNRSDLAEPRTTKHWTAFFQDHGYNCIAVDSVSGRGFDKVLNYLADLLKRKLALAQNRGIANAVLRVVALGVPNVGKSTFLNRLMGERKLRTGNKPGITRGRQWVRLFDDVEVLDTPGILRDTEALNRRKKYWMLLNLMPYTESLREAAADLLLQCIGDKGQQRIAKFYKFKSTAKANDVLMDVLEQIGHARGFLVQDDKTVDRAARTLLRDYQFGRFGRYSLELPGTAIITSPIFKSLQDDAE